MAKPIDMPFVCLGQTGVSPRSLVLDGEWGSSPDYPREDALMRVVTPAIEKHFRHI